MSAIDELIGLISNDALSYDEDVYEAPQQNFVGDIPIDVLSEERQSISFDIAMHPVEEGLDIIDNVIQQPIVIVLNCVQANDQKIPKGVDQITLLDATKTWRDKYADIKELIDRKEIIDITTSKDVYSGYILRSYTDSRRTGKSDALFFTLEFVQARTVTSQTVNVLPEQIPKEQKRRNKRQKPNRDKSGKSKKNQGEKPTKKSDLKKLVEGLLESTV